MKNKVKLVSSVLLYLGIIIGGYGLYRIYEVRSKQPEGVCAVDNNRSILVLGCVLLVGSVFVQWLGDKSKK